MALLPFGNEASEVNIVELLRKDHEKVKMLFREFNIANEAKQKQRIVEQAIAELDAHASAEEKVFYPAVRKDWPDAASHLNESREEHHVMRLLMDELTNTSPDNERFDAKFTVLAENVTHHIKEEEAELFARARTGRLDLEELGQQLLDAKASFQSRQKQKHATVRSKRTNAELKSRSSRPTAKKSKKRTAA